MGQQEQNHEATGPGVEEELDPFEQLAAALEAWTPDVSGDKKIIGLRSWDIVGHTWQPLELLVPWLKYRKSYDFANGFEGEFQRLYKEVKEFYDKVLRDEFTADELFDEQIPLLKSSSERLALYVLQVKAMFENDMAAAAGAFDLDEQERSPYVRISLRDRTILIGSTPHAPTADSVWAFLEELVNDSERGLPMPKAGNKGQVDMLRKAIGKEGLRCIVTFPREGYRLHPSAKVKR